MRHFLYRRYPAFTRVLLVESGSRGVFDRLIPLLYERNGEAMELDLVTCHPGEPAGFRGRIYRVQDYSGPTARQRLYRELAARQYSVAGILCSNEPIMTKWKWSLAARLPAKIIVINEFADFFWLDRGNLRNALRLVRLRLGFCGSAVTPALGRLLLFPAALVFLLLYAAVVHTRRRLRLIL